MTRTFNIANIFRQAIYLKRLKVIIGKIITKFFVIKKSNEANIKWLKENSVDFEAYIKSIESPLSDELKEVVHEIVETSDNVLKNIPCELGGGGCYPLIYLIIRKLRPDVVVETGVAAGFSSYASLLALKANGKGRLYSSDFPYFRIREPEKYIGCVVPQELKEDWDLYIDGDKANIPQILSGIDKIDFLHYDSDKSYVGRASAMELFSPYLNSDSIVIMDDIQDNPYFYEYVCKNDITDWKVFYFERKYLGIVGLSRIG